jgi:hypothetical protein
VPSQRSPEQRALAARIAAHEKWARTPDRARATAPARDALMAKFEREVDPDGVLSPPERARCAESARKAYFARLAYKSAQARSKGRKPTDEQRDRLALLRPSGGAGA